MGRETQGRGRQTVTPGLRMDPTPALHMTFFILGKSNGQSLVSLIYYLFQSKTFWQNLIMFK